MATSALFLSMGCAVEVPSDPTSKPREIGREFIDPPATYEKPKTPPPRASAPEVNALLQQLHRMTPPQKVKAYTHLLESSQAGVDEVFLMGLNEDDPDILTIIVSYFIKHHPPEAIEPLVDVLIFVQGDKALRGEVAAALISFGPEVLTPVLDRIHNERPERLAGGAMDGFSHIMGQVIIEGGAPELNALLEKGGRQGLKMMAPLLLSNPGEAIAGDEETIQLLHNSLKRELNLRRSDPIVLDAALALLCRIAQSETPPGNMQIITPLIPRTLPLSASLWGIYGALFFGDFSAVPALTEEIEAGGQRRFWALQALGVIGGAASGPVILQGLVAAEEDVRAAAAWAIAHQLLISANPGILKALKDPRHPSIALVEAAESLANDAAAPLLESCLAGAPREVQGAILRALLPVANRALAKRIEGWLEVELLIPYEMGRLNLEEGPALDVVEGALWILAGHGENPQTVEAILRRLGSPQGDGFQWVKRVAQSQNTGFVPLLKSAFLGESPPPQRDAAQRLLLLAQGMVGANAKNIPKTLESILLSAKKGAHRSLAAKGLFHVGTADNISALKKALVDPYYIAGPFPIYDYPTRRHAALALNRLRVPIKRQVDGHYLSQ